LFCPHLLFGVKLHTYHHLGVGGSFLAGERWQRISDMRENVEEVAFLGADYPLHLGHLLFAEPLLCQSLPPTPWPI
jgi:hypothetical protein